MFSPRGLLLTLTTLLTFVWFLGFSAMARQQGRDPAHRDPLSQLDTSLLNQRAAAGDAQAAYRLGRCYMEGIGVPQDDSESAKWF
jgi:TPR repeat protein